MFSAQFTVLKFHFLAPSFQFKVLQCEFSISQFNKATGTEMPWLSIALAHIQDLRNESLTRDIVQHGLDSG